MKRLLLLLFGVLLLLGGSANSLDPDSLLRDFEAREGRDWIIHRNADRTVSCLYGLSPVREESTEKASARFLKNYADLLGIQNTGDLRLEQMEKSATGTHFQYQQYYSGVPVVGGVVMIHVNRSNQVVAATSHFRKVTGVSGSLLVTAERAGATAEQFIRAGKIAPPELVILPGLSSAQLAWRVLADPDDLTNGSWILYVSARDPRLILRTRKAHVTFEGRGNVYLENQVVTPQRTIKTFTNMDATKSLAGKFVKTYNANFEKWYSFTIPLDQYTTASDPARDYDYATDDARFTEAMGYFHINRVHDSWRQVGFNRLNKRMPIFVNVVRPNDAGGFDNAFYSRGFTRFPGTGLLVFGSGEVYGNFGQDADVIYHEYGHAILDRMKPGFFDAIENNYAGAMHEGFGDIVSSTITGNPKLAEYALRRKSNKKFYGRNIDNNNRFPQDVIWPPVRRSESHHTGLIVGGSWWDLQELIGLKNAQKLLFRSLSFLPNEMTFFDWRDAMITADRNSGAAYQTALQQAFAKHGLDGPDPGQPGAVTITGLKTAELILSPFRIRLKKTFKRGDIILIFANYKGTGLTPGYNLITEDLQLQQPNGSDASAYGWIDEVSNGTRTGLSGAILAEVDTWENSKPGRYTIKVQARLGGTNKVLEPKTTSFKLN